MKTEWKREVTLKDKQIKVVVAAIKMAMSEGFYDCPVDVTSDDLDDTIIALGFTPRQLEDSDWEDFE